MGIKARALLLGAKAQLVIRLVVRQVGDHMERVQAALGRGTHIDHLAMESFRHLGVLIFRVEDKDLRILRRQVGQNGLRGKGFTGAGFTDNDNIGIHALTVSHEEVHKSGHARGISDVDAVLIVQVLDNIGKSRCHRTRMDAVGICQEGIVGRNRRRGVAFKLLQQHVRSPETKLRHASPQILLHLGFRLLSPAGGGILPLLLPAGQILSILVIVGRHKQIRVEEDGRHPANGSNARNGAGVRVQTAREGIDAKEGRIPARPDKTGRPFEADPETHQSVMYILIQIFAE